MNRLARRWFYLDELERRHGPEGDGRLELVVAHGLAYLQDCAREGRRFDAIFNDTFIASAPNRSLVSEEAAHLVKTCLTPEGVYLSNVISALTGSGAATLDHVCDSFATQFEQVSVVPCDLDHPSEVGNCVVIASDEGQFFPGTWMSYAGLEPDDAGF
jgi:spermidine synthase